ncbi:Rof/RNase P-like protein [Gilbertella persicaria]|uniref:Rof/RNase P-like protein n=1 Tax=Gilbertella persicaria TaxID=101096 RepID=UPI00222127B3|nr:Rof/RNase P-like protein [Gilbertella persicaria]KAI8095059.1 Rof/RNase P-like protein [Gilbertella persicaria]
MDKGESVYQQLPGSTSCKLGSKGVKEFVKDFIKPTSDADKVLREMKPIYIDRAHTFVKEEDKKAEKKKQRNKKERKLTAREKRRLKVYDIPKDAHQYRLFEPLAKLWQGYMSKLLTQGQANFEQKLIRADFHGAILTVVQSANPTYVGVTGIVIQETLSVFNMITKQDKLKQIPKNSSYFSVHIEETNKDYTIYGPQFVARPAERAAKKFKPKPSIDL